MNKECRLPEGAAVVVTYIETPLIHVCKNPKRVELPLVPSGESGSIHLTNERIYEILNNEDILTFDQGFSQYKNLRLTILS